MHVGAEYIIEIIFAQTRELELAGEVMAEWSVQETRSLLGIWGDADVQSKLDGVVRNRTIYDSDALLTKSGGNLLPSHSISCPL